MSSCDSHPIQCPSCGHSQELLVWHSINSMLNPELKKQLLDRSLMTFRCERCSHQVRLQYPLLYHDMEKQLMIRLLPEGAELPPEALAVAAQLEDFGYQLRIVHDLEELLEKIRIADDGLDDRVVELCKLELWDCIEKSKTEEECRLLYGNLSQQDGASVTVFMLLVGKWPLSMPVPMGKGYGKCEREYRAVLPPRDTETGVWLRVDREYATWLRQV